MSNYNEPAFWEKIGKLPRTISKEVIEKAVVLYVLLTEEDVPLWAKTSIVATLGYFVCPFDLIPDFLPGGFVDDLAAMAALVAELTIYVTPSVRRQVKDRLPNWCQT